MHIFGALMRLDSWVLYRLIVRQTFKSKQSNHFPMIASNINSSNDIEIGKLTDSGRTLDNMPFNLSQKDLNKHTFVCGITGSGKTTTVKAYNR